MHSKMRSEPEKSAKPSTRERASLVVEHRMKRMHEAETRKLGEEFAAALNAAVRAGKPIR